VELPTAGGGVVRHGMEVTAALPRRISCCFDLEHQRFVFVESGEEHAAG
jgi:hypothetical protein